MNASFADICVAHHLSNPQLAAVTRLKWYLEIHRSLPTDDEHLRVIAHTSKRAWRRDRIAVMALFRQCDGGVWVYAGEAQTIDPATRVEQFVTNQRHGVPPHISAARKKAVQVRWERNRARRAAASDTNANEERGTKGHTNVALLYREPLDLALNEGPNLGAPDTNSQTTSTTGPTNSDRALEVETAAQPRVPTHFQQTWARVCERIAAEKGEHVVARWLRPLRIERFPVFENRRDSQGGLGGGF